MTTPHTQQRNIGTMTNLGPEGARLAQLRSPFAKIPPLLLALVMVSVVLLIIVGGSLFFLPELAQSRWVWPLLPFNTRFLGAIYLTSLVGLISLVISRRVTLARLIIPMMAVFTTIVLMVSCLQLQQFNSERRLTDLWFWLYWLDCVGATYFCGYLKSYDFSGLPRLPRPWSVGLGIQGGLLGAYGVSLLLSPVAAGAAWLWPLDVFHAQLYSAIFLAGALGSALLSRSATTAEARSLGLIQVTFSSLVLLGLWLVDREVQRMDWGSLGTWAWVGAIALLGLSGLGLIKQSSSIKQNKIDV
ncbi:MAG: hypothetical protein AAFY33_02320 [Cyanobacteria bacterium J06643_4]